MAILKVYTRKLPDALRQSLKKPMGPLIKGSPSETQPHILRFIRTQRPRLVVTIGDESSKVGARLKDVRWVSVFDRKIERRQVNIPELKAEKTVKVTNEPGTISAEARRVLRTVLGSSSNVNVVVEGEEDLLTLAVLLYAPNGTVALYGQPSEGIVAVVVDEKIRHLARRIISRMEVVK